MPAEYGASALVSDLRLPLCACWYAGSHMYMQIMAVSRSTPISSVSTRGPMAMCGMVECSGAMPRCDQDSDASPSRVSVAVASLGQGCVQTRLSVALMSRDAVLSLSRHAADVMSAFEPLLMARQPHPTLVDTCHPGLPRCIIPAHARRHTLCVVLASHPPHPCRSQPLLPPLLPRPPRCKSLP